MKKDRQEPVFLLEMPHALRHMIMRRGLMLRGGRTRTLCCMNKGGPKAWLEAKLIPNSGELAEENWDKAHELAAKFKRELHADVYVEPASRTGRFAESREVSQPATYSIPMPPMPQQRTSGFSINGGFGPKLPDVTGLGLHRIPGHQQAISMADDVPHLPDPMEEINSLIAGTQAQAKKRNTLKCSDLHILPGWVELPANLQQMFETEAAQAIDMGLASDSGITHGQQSVIALLGLQVGLSRKLREFLQIT